MTGKTLSDFELPATGNQRFRLSVFRGHPLVIYFYPRDNTPGCTGEGMQFRDLHPQFRALGYHIFGISRDSIPAHEKFKANMGFPFELLSDTDESVCNLFGVMKLKNMYGKQVRGIERSTFLIDANGSITKEWRGVKVPGHAQDVLNAIKVIA
jgi:peroxiredoxin Q/BCP